MQAQRSKIKYSGSQILIEVISNLFILLFVYAAVSKLLDYHHFRIEMGKSPLLATIAGWLSWILPAIEICLAFSLVIPKSKLLATYFSFDLLILFTAYLIAVLHFSFFVPCTCGGVLQKMGWNTHILFNIFFILLGLVSIVLQTKMNSKSFANSCNNCSNGRLQIRESRKPE